MSASDPIIRAKRLHKRLLLLASFIVLCVMVGSLSFAVSDNGRRQPNRSQGANRSHGSEPVSSDSQGAEFFELSNSRTIPRQVRPVSFDSNESDSSFKFSDTVESVEAIPHRAEKMELIEFDDVPLHEAMRLFSDQSGLNVITSTEAGKIRITVFLKHVTPIDALEAIVKANGLFYRVEASSGIVRIATLAEYEKDLSSFREEQTRVFTLLYPNPSAVAQVIKQVFGNRVQLNRADGEIEELVDLSQRFNRFDIMDGRSLGLGNNSGRRNNQLAQFGRNMSMQLNPLTLAGMGSLGMANSLGFSQMQQLNPGAGSEPVVQLTPDQIQQVENALAEEGRLNEELRADLSQQREATIYVSTIRRNNQVIVRTGDERSMEQISGLIAQLDVPTPTVLLEVKVLRVLLAEGFQSSFEFLGGSKSTTSFSDGSLSPTFPGGSTLAQSLGHGLGVAGGVPGALTFQVVDEGFRVRMQLLESKNCVTALATPLILTANNEVSRIFVGDTLPFTIGFTPSQVLSSVGAVNGAVAATPITELRDVGQSLLITPNINADRTVTLRVVEENSERVVGGSSIPVPASSGTGVTNISVDTVRRRTISGTVVAQDGMAVALGGMIEEHASDSRDQVPMVGSIPGLGALFRRKASKQVRSELVVLIRPYIFNTPSESAATTESLLGELSKHPANGQMTGASCLRLPCAVTRTDAECIQRAKLFHFHSGVAGCR